MLTPFQKAGETFKLQKCCFFAEKMNYLGHAIRPRRTKIAEKITKATQKLQALTTHKDVKYFLCLCNFSPWFVPKVSSIAGRVNRKLRKDQPSSFHKLTTAEKKPVDGSKNLNNSGGTRPLAGNRQTYFGYRRLQYLSQIRTPSTTRRTIQASCLLVQNANWQQNGTFENEQRVRRHGIDQGATDKPAHTTAKHLLYVVNSFLSVVTYFFRCTS